MLEICPPIVLDTYILPEVALERQVEGDLFLQDIGQGFGFRPGSFDGAIRSIFLNHRNATERSDTCFSVYPSSNGY